MKRVGVAAALALLGLAGCGRGAADQNTAAAPAEAAQALTVHQIMLGQVVPASNAVWAIQEAPDDAGWKAAADNAQKLVDAANTLVSGEHPLLGPGETVQGGDAPGASTPAQIEDRIRAAPDDWRKHAQAMQAASLQVIAAAGAKDLDRVMDAGNTLYDTCEACHQQFWHPEQAQ